MAMGITYGDTNTSFFGIEENLVPHDDVDGAWLHPFENNLLETKFQIVKEVIMYDCFDEGNDEKWADDQHLDLCRQLAGGN